MNNVIQFPPGPALEVIRGAARASLSGNALRSMRSAEVVKFLTAFGASISPGHLRPRPPREAPGMWWRRSTLLGWVSWRSTDNPDHELIMALTERLARNGSSLRGHRVA